MLREDEPGGGPRRQMRMAGDRSSLQRASTYGFVAFKHEKSDRQALLRCSKGFKVFCDIPWPVGTVPTRPLGDEPTCDHRDEAAVSSEGFYSADCHGRAFCAA